MTGRPIAVATAIALLLATRQNAFGQTTQSQIVVGGGIATDVRGITTDAATLAPSMTWTPDPRLALGVGGSATRFESRQWSLTGNGTAAARLPLGAFAALTFDGGGALTNTSYDVAYATADATPALELRGGPFAAFAGAHAAYGRSSAATQSTLPLGGFSGAPAATRDARSAVGAVFGGSARMTSDEVAVVGYREEHASVQRVPFVDRGVSASVSNGPFTVSGSYGTRAAPDEHTSFGGATVSVALPGSLALELGGGTYPSNRITRLPGGRFLSAGIALRLGAPPALVPNESPLPAPLGVAPPASGMTRLSIRAADASRVDVAGDWTNWTSVPARRAPNGVWYVDQKIAPGRYRYAFRVNGAEWRIPDGAAAVDDGFGGKSAWLTVRATPAVDQHTKEER